MLTKLETDSKVSQVYVYSDRALVTRNASLDLEPGNYEISFTNLPYNIMKDTIRASGRGPKGTKILGVDIKQDMYEQPPEERIAELTKKIQDLQDKDKSFANKLEVLSTKQAFIKDIDTNSRANIPQQLSKGNLQIQDFEKIVSLLFTNMENINNEIHQINLQRRELNLQMQLLKKELGEISTPRPLQKSRIIVAVEVVQKGKVDIDVIYSIMGANWYPSYEVRVFTDVKPEEKNVELTYYGIVSQWTGEVWEDSYIFLSTAKPAVGADLPKLNPWYLNFYVPVPPPSYAVAGKARMEKAEEKAKKVFEDEVMPKEAPLTGVQFPSPPPQPVEVVTSQIERKGAGLLFKVPKSATINPDSSPNKTTIAIEKFLSTLDYVSVPKLAEYAYLRAKIKNETEYQFLPGKVNVFYGNDLVGSSSIGNIAPTEEFEVYLGIDEEIKVKRELEEKESGKSGLVGQSYKQNYAYKITVENFKKEKKKITIFDQIPISQNDDIKVKSGDIKPTPVEQTKQGILRWEFELEPKQKQEIYFQFSVEYPKDRQITGL